MMRIAYIIDSMYNSGGMERVLTVCANALSDFYSITIITGFQQKRSYFFNLSSKVRCHDLDIIEDKPYKKKKVYKDKLSCYLKKESFDVVVSLGGLEYNFLYSIHDGSKKLVWFHFAIDIAKTVWVGPNPNILKRIKSNLQTLKRIYIAKKYDNIIVISNSDSNAWKKYTSKVIHIYNPITINSPVQSKLQSKSVISVGRLDYQKGYDLLIDAWSVVAKKYRDWRLDIYGDGEQKNLLQAKINDLNLSSSIYLCGGVTNISEKYADHSIYVMSSRAEGLGLVLLEAASCGLPLISFDCPSGPGEIIQDGVNGFLVSKVGDINSLAEKICLLISDELLRVKMGRDAKKTVDIFSLQNIIKQWRKLYDELGHNEN